MLDLINSCFLLFVFQSRKEILKIHTRQWKPPPSEDFLDELAEKCVGGWDGNYVLFVICRIHFFNKASSLNCQPLQVTVVLTSGRCAPKRRSAPCGAATLRSMAPHRSSCWTSPPSPSAAATSWQPWGRWSRPLSVPTPVRQNRCQRWLSRCWALLYATSWRSCRRCFHTLSRGWRGRGSRVSKSWSLYIRLLGYYIESDLKCCYLRLHARSDLWCPWWWSDERCRRRLLNLQHLCTFQLPEQKLPTLCQVNLNTTLLKLTLICFKDQETSMMTLAYWHIALSNIKNVSTFQS